MQDFSRQLLACFENTPAAYVEQKYDVVMHITTKKRESLHPSGVIMGPSVPRRSLW